MNHAGKVDMVGIQRYLLTIVICLHSAISHAQHTDTTIAIGAIRDHYSGLSYTG